MKIVNALLPALFMATATPAQAAPVAKAVFVDTFDNPVYVTRAPGSNTLLFVVEQTGRIQVLDNEFKQPLPFLDISARISCCGERGLLSMAFAPDYDASRLFYVAFTNTNGDVEVDEFRRSPTDPLRADVTSRRRL